MKKLASRNARALLIGYLVFLMVTATLLLIPNIPLAKGEVAPKPTFGFVESVLAFCRISLPMSQKLAYLAFLAGMIGSFIHTTQSLATFMGNRNFFSSWIAWYYLRPWIGGVLGLTLYFVLAGGLISGMEMTGVVFLSI